MKRTRAYFRRQRISLSVANIASHRRKRSSRKPPHVLSQTQYIQPDTRAQSQCWFVVYWLYSTCDSRYGRQSGHVKPDLGTCVYSPAHHWLPDRRSRATVAFIVSSAHECWKHVMCNYTTRHAIRDNLLFTRAIPRIFARFPCVLSRWWRATSCGKVFQGFATRI